MQNIFVGRQPIMNKMLDVFGYELLFRESQSNSASIKDGNLATSQVIRNAFIDMDMLKLTRGLKCFINVTRDFLLENEPLSVPPDQVVFELSETETVDEELVETIKKMRAEGVEFALDDYNGDERWDPLLDTVSYIKVDVQSLTHEQVVEVAEKLSEHKTKMLAEKVETNADLATCSELGFKYFQGYFFAKPEVVAGKTIAANQAQAMQLLSELQSPDVELENVQDIISRDVALSYGVLKLVNSAAFGLSDKIESIQSAVSYIGLKPLTRWLTLLVITNSEEQNTELLSLAIIRGRMCELLSQRANYGDSSAFFTAGLFSMLEAIMQTSIADIIDKIPLSDEITSALIESEGVMGSAIGCAKAYEECEWDSAEFLDLDVNDIVDIYTESVNWANETISSVAA